jgi:hypothetical protein
LEADLMCEIADILAIASPWELAQLRKMGMSLPWPLGDKADAAVPQPKPRPAPAVESPAAPPAPKAKPKKKRVRNKRKPFVADRCSGVRYFGTGVPRYFCQGPCGEWLPPERFKLLSRNIPAKGRERVCSWCKRKQRNAA